MSGVAAHVGDGGVDLVPDAGHVTRVMRTTITCPGAHLMPGTCPSTLTALVTPQPGWNTRCSQ